MADRSDDIKQLFSHLGLNPGDYQEMREKTRALSRGIEAAMPQPAASTLRVPEAPVSKAAPAAAPQTTPVPPTVRLNPLIARAPVTSGGEATQRWPLIKAAVETPTRVAQRPEVQAVSVTPEAQPRVAAPTSVAASAPVAAAPQTPASPPVRSAPSPAAPTKVLGSASEVATLLKAVEQAKAMERAESDAIERTTRRVVDELQRSRLPTAKAPEPAAAAQPVPPAAAPEPVVAQAPELKPTFFQKPAAVAAGSSITPPPVAAKPAVAESKADPVDAAASAVPGSELQSAFQRLVDPERVPQQRFSRLKLNYGASEAPSKPRKPKEENLEDVFSRISGPTKSR